MEYPRKIAMKIKFTYMIVPYAATPFSPANFISCRLYNEFTIELERFVISSDEPLVQVRRRIFP